MPLLASGAKKNIRIKSDKAKTGETRGGFMSFREGAQRQASAQNGTFWKTTSVLRLRWDFFGVDSSEASGLTSEHMDFVGGSEVDATKKYAWCNACIASATCQQMETPWRRICFIVLSKQRSHPIFTLQAFPALHTALFLGKKKGAQDGQGRGLLVFEGLKYIARWKPSVVVLESVARQSAPSRQSARGRH